MFIGINQSRRTVKVILHLGAFFIDSGEYTYNYKKSNINGFHFYTKRCLYRKMNIKLFIP